MNSIHLTEEMIQLIAIEGIETNPSAKDHISECIACSTHLKSYLELVENLNNQPIVKFEFNVTEIVMRSLSENLNAIPVKKAAIPKSILFPTITAATFILIYLFREELLAFSKITNEITLYLICAGGIILLSILVWDVIRDYENKMNSLNHQ